MTRLHTFLFTPLDYLKIQRLEAHATEHHGLPKGVLQKHSQWQQSEGEKGRPLKAKWAGAIIRSFTTCIGPVVIDGVRIMLGRSKGEYLWSSEDGSESGVWDEAGLMAFMLGEITAG